MFAFIGVAIITLVMLWACLGLLQYALMCFVMATADGSTLFGVLCLLGAVGVGVLWYFIVGTHIHVSFA